MSDIRISYEDGGRSGMHSWHIRIAIKYRMRAVLSATGFLLEKDILLSPRSG